MHWQPSHCYNHQHFHEEDFVHVRNVKVLAHEQNGQEVDSDCCYLQHDHWEVQLVDLRVHVQTLYHDESSKGNRHDVGEAVLEENDSEQDDS